MINLKQYGKIAVICLSWVSVNFVAIYTWPWMYDKAFGAPLLDVMKNYFITFENYLYLFQCVVTVYLINKVFIKADIKLAVGVLKEKQYYLLVVLSIAFLLISIASALVSNRYIIGEILGIIVTQYLFIAIVEELTFRLMVHKLLAAKNYQFVICVSSVTFLIMHCVLNPHAISASMMISIQVLGLLLAAIYQDSQSTAVSGLVHGTYNLAVELSGGTIATALGWMYLVLIYYLIVYRKYKGRQ